MPVYKRESNGLWFAQVNYKNEYGKYKTKNSKYFETKREAQDEEIRIKLSLKNGTIRTSENKITFQQAYDEFVESQKLKVKNSTLVTYPSMWAHFTLRDLQIEKLTVPLYNEFKSTLLDKGLSPHRANNIHKLIRQVVEYAQRMYDIENNVVQKCGGFKDTESLRKKNIDFYTYDEFNLFISNVEELRYKALFTFLYYEGTRIGEANAITWKDIDFENKQITINKTANTKVKGISHVVTSTKKTASDRVIPLIEDVEVELRLLQDEMKRYKNYDNSWFVFGGSRPMPESHLHDVKNEAADKAGLKHIRIHDFRHSSASFYISELNLPPSDIQALLGHSSLQITLNTYNHLYPNKLNSIAEKLKQYKQS